MPPVKFVTQESHEHETNKEANCLPDEEDFKLNVKSDEYPQSNERELIKSSLLEGETKKNMTTAVLYPNDSGEIWNSIIKKSRNI